MTFLKHRPTPWSIINPDGPEGMLRYVVDVELDAVCTTSSECARRIVACVNALAPYTTEAIESGRLKIGPLDSPDTISTLSLVCENLIIALKNNQKVTSEVIDFALTELRKINRIQ